MDSAVSAVEVKIERVRKQLVGPAVAHGDHDHAAGSDDGRPNVQEWVALSSADLGMMALHMELLLVYAEAPPTAAAALTSSAGELETALAKVLCSYPEWAGRIDKAHAAAGRSAIVLNGAGAAFLEAQAHGPLTHLMPCFDGPFHPFLVDLIPPHHGASELLLLQVTRFTCGGMTIGVAWHHQVADGEAIMDFLHAWALTTKGIKFPFSSSKDRHLLMARDPPQPIYDQDEFTRSLMMSDTTFKSKCPEKQEVVMRKLYFSADLLAAIREEAGKGGSNDRYTRFESLLGHLWRCITKARGLEDDEGGEQMSRLKVAVNVRKRMNPTIGNGYFGNAMTSTFVKANPSKLLREPLGYAATLVKDAIKKVDDNYVRSSLDYMELRHKHPLEGSQSMRIQGLTPNLIVTSWAMLPLYNLDFGSGCPLFASNYTFFLIEGFLLILPPPLPSDGGLYVVVSLSDFAMKNLLSLYDSIL